MKLLVISVLVGACLGDRLENTYLPPFGARSSGRSGSFLSAPRRPHTGSGVGPGGGFASGPFGQGSYYNVHVPILRLNNDNDGSGQYRYEYETGNGIRAYEAGHVRPIFGQEANQVQGAYSYTAPDGVQYSVSYTADENGFHPQGEHLPTPPPIPDAILRSLQYNAQHGDDDGQYYSGAHRGGSGGHHPQFAGSRQYLPPRKSGYNY